MVVGGRREQEHKMTLQKLRSTVNGPTCRLFQVLQFSICPMYRVVFVRAWLELVYN